MRMISASLDVKVYQTNNTDLEVVSRAASCFVAFATYTDGASIGVDDSLTHSYLSLLSKFASLATSHPSSEKPDVEEQSRARLIGLSALSGAANSEAVFSSSVEFPRQVNVIVPALLSILGEAPLAELKVTSASVTTGEPVSPYFHEVVAGGLPPGPRTDRRAPSLQEHVPGEKGPSSEDVYSAAFRCLYNLVSECQSNQAERVLDVVFNFFDRHGWQDVERCCWITERMTAAMLLQSRSIVPTALVDLLLNMPDDVPPTAKHTTVVAMVTTVLSSSVSLVGLGVTDILASLISVIIRRVSVDQRDGLIPALVNCVASLGTHIYYADQINDIVEEIAVQMAAIPSTDPARQEILRVLIHCITGVMSAADRGDEAEARAVSPTSEWPEKSDKGKGPQLESPAVEIPRRDLGRRNPIAPEVWQETLPLLCEATYPVRAVYARALLFYLETEMPRDRKPRPDEPNIVRFCNALQAAIYTLAVSSRLGVGEPLPSMPATPKEEILEGGNKTRSSTPHSMTPPRGSVTFNVVSPTPGTETPSGTGPLYGNGLGNGVPSPRTSMSNNGSAFPGTFNPDIERTMSQRSTHGGATPPRKPLRGGRRVSLPLNRLLQSSPEITSFDNVATPFDYAVILRILDELNNCCPVAALLTEVPMLLALDRDAGCELIRRNAGAAEDSAWVLERKRACRETAAVSWRRLGVRWGVPHVIELSDRAINSLSEPFIVPEYRNPAGHGIEFRDEPAQFVRDNTEGESAASSLPLLDATELIAAFSDAPAPKAASMRDAPWLQARFSAPWSVEAAIRESVERFTSPVAGSDSAAAATLMAIPNTSYQSLGRPVSRAVDVSDLREALGNGAAGSAAGSIISTSPSTGAAGGFGALGSGGHGAGGAANAGNAGAVGAVAGEKRAKPDAKEILKEIFKDKKPSRA